MMRGTKPFFQLPWFALELAGIRRIVVQIKGLERDGLVPLRVLVVASAPAERARSDEMMKAYLTPSIDQMVLESQPPPKNVNLWCTITY